MKKYTIILLHGWGQTHKSMDCFEEELKKYYEVKNIDLLKISKDEVYDLNDYLIHLHNAIKDYKNLILIGHSFGGKLASLYASTYKVEKLILLAPSTYIKKSFKTKTKIILHKAIKFLKIKKLMNAFKSNDYKKLSGKEQITFKNIIKNIDKNHLKSISIPTLIFAFKNDKQVNYKSLKYLNKIIPDSKLKTFSGDHFAYLDNLENIILEMMEFMYA